MSIPSVIAVVLQAGGAVGVAAVGAERTAAIEREVELLIEGRNRYRAADLVASYAASLEIAEIPAVVDAFAKRESGSFKALVLNEILDLWAERDPYGAWRYIDPLYDAVASDHFANFWAERILVPDRAAVKRLPIIPEIGDLHGFIYGLRRSSLPLGEKEKLRDRWARRHAAADPSEKLGDLLAEDLSRSSKDRDADSRDPAKLYQVWKMIEGAEPTPEGGNPFPALLEKFPSEAAQILRRWTQTAATMPPAEALQAAEGDRVLKGIVYRAWAQRDAESLLAFSKEGDPQMWLENGGDFAFPFLPPEQRESILVFVAKEDRDLLIDLLDRWGEIEPEAAFRKAEEILSEDCEFSDFACSLFYSDISAHERRVAGLLMNSRRLVLDVNAYIIMEELGDLDVALASKYAVQWHLKAMEPRFARLDQAYSKRHLLQVWTGKKDPWDASMDDRAFGCLRKWASIAPDEMKAWAKTLEDEPIREALLWMAEHPNG